MTDQKPVIMDSVSMDSGSIRQNPPVRSDNPSEESGRERLKRHRTEVAGRVWIPDIWGREELLKDWIDCNAFDSSLVNSSLVSARTALVQEVRTAANPGLVLRIENTY